MTDPVDLADPAFSRGMQALVDAGCSFESGAGNDVDLQGAFERIDDGLRVTRGGKPSVALSREDLARPEAIVRLIDRADDLYRTHVPTWKGDPWFRMTDAILADTGTTTPEGRAAALGLALGDEEDFDAMAWKGIHRWIALLEDCPTDHALLEEARYAGAFVRSGARDASQPAPPPEIPSDPDAARIHCELRMAREYATVEVDEAMKGSSLQADSEEQLHARRETHARLADACGSLHAATQALDLVAVAGGTDEEEALLAAFEALGRAESPATAPLAGRHFRVVLAHRLPGESLTTAAERMGCLARALASQQALPEVERVFARIQETVLEGKAGGASADDLARRFASRLLQGASTEDALQDALQPPPPAAAEEDRTVRSDGDDAVVIGGLRVPRRSDG